MDRSAQRIDFAQPADVVAPLLLGAVLRHGGVAIELTEVEAYLGIADEASHAFNGPTPRCEVMFGPPQHLYVYASYGIHRAGNLVCSPDGEAGGVLLRAGKIIEGLEIARARRGSKPADEALARGPGNLGAALGLNLDLNGSAVDQVISGAGDTSSPAAPFTLTPRTAIPEITRGKRIGITKNADALLRFWVPGDRSVSSPRGRQLGSPLRTPS